MPFPVKTVNAQGPRELCPADNMRGLLTRIFYVGHVPNTFEPDKPAIEQLVFFFELDAEDSNGKRHVLSKTMTFSLHESSNMTKVFAPILGEKWPKTGQQLNIGDLLGITCMVSVVHYIKRDGSEGAKISTISKLARGMDELQSDSDIVLLSFDDPQFADNKNVPQWVRDLAATNLESTGGLRNGTQNPATPPAPASQNKMQFGPFSAVPVDENGETPF